jgi:DNA-binding transcriptional ArsR family regulator
MSTLNENLVQQQLENDLQPLHNLDRIIHEPARLLIMTALNTIAEADFKFLCSVTGLSKGNLSRQSTLLEEAGYIEIRKYYRGRVPATGYRMTENGHAAFAQYWQHMADMQKNIQNTDVFVSDQHDPK